MSIDITIRNVPDAVRDELAARAARSGQSLQEYLRGELDRLAQGPGLEQWLNQVKQRKKMAPRVLRADTILGHRSAERT